jgi:pimeloyl-ACP methyl ester carboxylesterase
MSSSQAADLNNRGGKVFVLVHGAGQGAWAFGKVAWPLARDGHQVIARDLPGHGLRARYPQSYLERPSDPDRFATEPSPLAQLSAQDFADELIATISQLAQRMPGRQIVLAGHSFGGLTLSRVGEAIPQLISRVVYISAVMPAPGKSLFDYLAIPEFSASKIPPLLIGDPQATGALRLDFRSADPGYRAQIKAAIAADVDDHQWQAVTNLLSPDVPARWVTEPVALTADRWGSIPRTYISCTADFTIPAAAHRLFIDEADKLTPVTPPTSGKCPPATARSCPNPKSSPTLCSSSYRRQAPRIGGHAIAVGLPCQSADRGGMLVPAGEP